MPDFTPNLSLEKPRRNEGYDVEVQNRNMVRIDDELHAQKENFTQQLAQKAGKNEVNALATAKADKLYVDTLIANVAGGAPRGVFYSIATLNATYPTGEIGTYLVFDSTFTDGAHVFIWNDNVWVDLGLYQSAADSVTNALTDDGQEWIL